MLDSGISGVRAVGYRTILADASGNRQAGDRLRLSRVLGARFGAAVVGTHVMPVHAARPGAADEPDGWAGEILPDRRTAHGADPFVAGAHGHAGLRELVPGGRRAARHATRRCPRPSAVEGHPRRRSGGRSRPVSPPRAASLLPEQPA
jgi:hypothetical protein